MEISLKKSKKTIGKLTNRMSVFFGQINLKLTVLLTREQIKKFCIFSYRITKKSNRNWDLLIKEFYSKFTIKLMIKESKDF
jgi:hypothetical protein